MTDPRVWDAIRDRAVGHDSPPPVPPSHLGDRLTRFNVLHAFRTIANLGGWAELRGWDPRDPDDRRALGYLADQLEGAAYYFRRVIGAYEDDERTT